MPRKFNSTIPESSRTLVGYNAMQAQAVFPGIIDGYALDALTALCGGLPFGLLVLTGAGRILFANQAARQLLEGENGLRDTGGVITAVLPDECRRLREALLAATQGHEGERSALWIGNCSDRARMPVAILPAGGSRNMALMFVSTSDPEWAPARGLIQGLFDLTRTESEVTRLIVSGKSIEEVATALNIAESTVRNHLKRVFAKTATKRQAELVSLVLRSPASWAPLESHATPQNVVVGRHAGSHPNLATFSIRGEMLRTK